MTLTSRIEATLAEAVGRVQADCAPPRLAAGDDHAVLPGGARVRPQLCLSVALACGDDRPELSDAAAAAIELIHCASLVHDDLPCFDDADMRRGRPSVHRAYGRAAGACSRATPDRDGLRGPGPRGAVRMPGARPG